MAASLGYCAIIVPSRNFWQGLDISARAYEAGQKLIETTTRTLRLTPKEDNRNTLLDAFTGTLLFVTMGGDQERAGTLVSAISQLFDSCYFYVICTPEPHGIRSRVFNLAAESIDDARIKINALPEVLAIKKR